MPIDPVTVIFAVVAIIVVWKLHSVLGENTGLQTRTPPRAPKPQAEPGSNIVRLPGAAGMPKPNPERWRPFVTSEAGAVAGLDAIASADPSFSAAPFLDGARTAYEATLAAFAAADRRTLQTLLAPNVLSGFESAIVQREARRETLSTTLVSIDDAKIEAASLDGPTARAVVRFQSKQISATRSAAGEVVDGSADQVVDANDVWTFARDTTSRDPNWKLVETASGH